MGSVPIKKNSMIEAPARAPPDAALSARTGVKVIQGRKTVISPKKIGNLINFLLKYEKAFLGLALGVTI